MLAISFIALILFGVIGLLSYVRFVTNIVVYTVSFILEITAPQIIGSRIQFIVNLSLFISLFE